MPPDKSVNIPYDLVWLIVKPVWIRKAPSQVFECRSIVVPIANSFIASNGEINVLTLNYSAVTLELVLSPLHAECDKDGYIAKIL